MPYSLTFVFALAIRTLSVLYSDYVRIREARMARALEMEEGRFFDRLKKHVYLMGPLIVTALSRVEAMSASIESRAFRVKKAGKRTFYYVTHMRGVDYVIAASLLLETTAFLVLRYLYGHFTGPWLLPIIP